MTEWKNRITGADVKPAKWFLANEQNWRIHPQVQQEALKGSLDEIGWIQDVVVNQRTSDEWGENRNVETLLDGHLRVSLALRQGEDTQIPVKYVDLSPVEESLALIMLDPIAAMAGTDVQKLESLLRQVQSDDANVMQFLSNLAEKEGVFLDDEVDFEKFANAGNQNFLFRVVIDNLPTRELAEKIAQKLPDARIEQYRGGEE
jgi:hypothetical protein